jgi:WhiB family redox-sensing transcriptional regulator
MSTGWTMEASEDGERVLLPAVAARKLEELVERGWMVDAACVSVDPELWFPEKGGATSRAVLEICASCPVRTSCLATAIVNVEDGLWGGVQPVARSQARGRISRGADPLVVVDELLDQAADIGTRRRSAA